MNETREKYTNWNLVDIWQYLFIMHKIRIAKKEEQKHILFWNIVRPRVFKKIEKKGYRIYAQGGKGGYTWILW